jgi:hypothetical protein
MATGTFSVPRATGELGVRGVTSKFIDDFDDWVFTAASQDDLWEPPEVTLSHDSSSSSGLASTSNGLVLPIGRPVALAFRTLCAFGAGNSVPTVSVFNNGKKVGDLELTDGNPGSVTVIKFTPEEEGIQLELLSGGEDSPDTIEFISITVPNI